MGTQAAEASPRRGGAPFGFLRPAAGLAVAYAAAAVTWVAIGDVLPGGRWLAVHLFTLGVLTNLVAALTHHFAETVLHAPGDRQQGRRLVVLNVGVLGVLVGLPAGQPLLVASGAAVAMGAVFWLYRGLRRMRKQSLPSRFAFVVRGYERACGAFIHGAVLGALLGTGLLTGAWYGAGRLAHLHVNILGWGGLTLLSTLVFFGPTILRARIEEGADAVAARWIGHGATGLAVATLALLATGAQGPVAVGGRTIATVGLVVYAVAATRVCLPVLRAGRRARTSPHGRMVLAAAAWFTVTAWAAAAVAAAGADRYYDALGVALLVGVLGQAITASLGYLAPMVWPSGADRRAVLRDRLDRLPALRPVAYNLGAALVVAAAVAGPAAGAAGAGVIRVGWLLLASSVLAQVGLAVIPQPGRAARRAGARARPPSLEETDAR